MNVTSFAFRERGADKFAYLNELAMWVTLYPHRSELPLIADKLKPLFGLQRNNIFAIILNGKKYLAIPSFCDNFGHPMMLSSMHYLSEDHYEEIFSQMRAILVFRYVLDLRSMTMNEIRILPTSPLTLISTGEKTSGYDAITAPSKMTIRLMDTWFYKWSMKDTFSKLIPNGMSSDEFLVKFIQQIDQIVTDPLLRATIIKRVTRLVLK